MEPRNAPYHKTPQVAMYNLQTHALIVSGIDKAFSCASLETTPYVDTALVKESDFLLGEDSKGQTLRCH